jgi:hypothetical protein
MELLLKGLKDYGIWGIIIAALIYIILNSEITLRFPRPEKKSKRG